MSFVVLAVGIYSDWCFASDSFVNSVTDRPDWPVARNMNCVRQYPGQRSFGASPNGPAAIVERVNWRN